MDFSGMLASVDFSAVSVGLLAIAASVIGIQALGWGAGKILDMVDPDDNLNRYYHDEPDDYVFRTMDEGSTAVNASGRSYNDWNYWNGEGETFR